MKISKIWKCPRNGFPVIKHVTTRGNPENLKNETAKMAAFLVFPQAEDRSAYEDTDVFSVQSHLKTLYE